MKLSIKIILCLFLAVAIPLGVHYYSYLSYVNAYNGKCGPHAPDIPAYDCDYDTYISEWNEGFAGVGQFITDVMATGIGILMAVGLWFLLAWLKKDPN